MIQQLFTESSLVVIFFATVFYFLLLYFSFALTAAYLSKKYFAKYNIAKAYKNDAQEKQIKREIKYSLVSILIFGLFGVLPRIAYDYAWVNIVWDINAKYLFAEFVFVFLWNELHFYASHWLLHRKWFLKRVHYIHHQSYNPTPYSTYSFHWFEAFLLGTVMIIPMFFYDFCFVTLLFLPVMSIFLNTLGHWNHDLFPGKKNKLFKFSFRHSLHHSKVNGNFGFFIPFFDRLFKTELPEKE